MNFKDSITKSINMHMSNGGFKRAERDSKFKLYVPDNFANPELSVNKFSELSEDDKQAKRVISQLTDEIVNDIAREFERTATAIATLGSGKVTKEDKLREAFKHVDADMICKEHNKITCKTCFGEDFKNIPFDRASSEFKNANNKIWEVFTNTREEIEFLQDLIKELQGERVENPTVLDPLHGKKGGHAHFSKVFEFKHDNKNGFTGIVNVPDYMEKVIFEMYFDDETSLDDRRSMLAVEVETLFRSLVNAWITYKDKVKNQVSSKEWVKLKVANVAA